MESKARTRTRERGKARYFRALHKLPLPEIDATLCVQFLYSTLPSSLYARKQNTKKEEKKKQKERNA